MQACTGSGKTLAFLVPVIEMLKRRKEPFRKFDVGALVVTPTRELAHQISEVAEGLLEGDSLSVLRLVGGGASIEAGIFVDHSLECTAHLTKLIEVTQLKQKGASIIIGTPGRLIYFFNNVKIINLRELEVLNTPIF